MLIHCLCRFAPIFWGEDSIQSLQTHDVFHIMFCCSSSFLSCRFIVSFNVGWVAMVLENCERLLQYQIRSQRNPPTRSQRKPPQEVNAILFVFSESSKSIATPPKMNDTIDTIKNKRKNEKKEDICQEVVVIC